MVGESYTWAGVVSVSVTGVHRSDDSATGRATYVVDVRVSNANPRGYNTGAMTLGLLVGPSRTAATFDSATPGSSAQNAVVPGGSSIDAVYGFWLPITQAAGDVAAVVRPSPVAQTCLFAGTATAR